MFFVREQHDMPQCLYHAQVWLEHHSQQCACFATKLAATRWAERLHKRIVEADIIKVLHRGLGS